MNDWRIEHKKIIVSFLQFLNSKTDDYILKGGTSLMTCYGLDRFSEDIDFDSVNKSTIGKLVEEFCLKNNYTYRIAKKTETTQRYYINYGNAGKPLKIETSFRAEFIDKENSTCKINGIRVYQLNDIFMMKLGAYNGRDKIRDLFDITFICRKYWDNLQPLAKSSLISSLEYKGLDYFDYILKEQNDELIDNDKLAEDFLDMFDKTGLLFEQENEQDLTQENREIAED